METYEIKNGRLIRCNIFSETMEIPDNVKEIGKYVFALNTTIKNIILPKCCTIIDKAAFLYSPPKTARRPDLLPLYSS